MLCRQCWTPTGHTCPDTWCCLVSARRWQMSFWAVCHRYWWTFSALLASQGELNSPCTSSLDLKCRQNSKFSSSSWSDTHLSPLTFLHREVWNVQDKTGQHRWRLSFCHTGLRRIFLRTEHFKTIKKLKRNENIVIIRPDKGQGVVIVERTDDDKKNAKNPEWRAKFRKIGDCIDYDSAAFLQRSLQDLQRKLKKEGQTIDSVWWNPPKRINTSRIYGYRRYINRTHHCCQYCRWAAHPSMPLLSGSLSFSSQYWTSLPNTPSRTPSLAYSLSKKPPFRNVDICVHSTSKSFSQECPLMKPFNFVCHTCITLKTSLHQRFLKWISPEPP